MQWQASSLECPRGTRVVVSIYIDPIYFTLGSAFSRERLQQAVYTRVGMISNLPDRYMVKCPILCDGSSPQAHQPHKSKQIEIPQIKFQLVCRCKSRDHWLWYWKTVSRHEVKTMQALSLSGFLATLGYICSRWVQGNTDSRIPSMHCSYGQVKSLATDYQLANLIVVVAHTGSRSLTNKITLQ